MDPSSGHSYYSPHYDPYFGLGHMDDIPPHKNLDNEIGEIEGKPNENILNPHTSEISHPSIGCI